MCGSVLVGFIFESGKSCEGYKNKKAMRGDHAWLQLIDKVDKLGKD